MNDHNLGRGDQTKWKVLKFVIRRLYSLIHAQTCYSEAHISLLTLNLDFRGSYSDIRAQTRFQALILVF
jgi:hypothetical protein